MTILGHMRPYEMSVASQTTLATSILATGRNGTENAGLENAGPESDEPTSSGWKMTDHHELDWILMFCVTLRCNDESR